MKSSGSNIQQKLEPMKKQLAEARRESLREAMPRDLSEWVEKAQIREWIEDEIASLNWEDPELAGLMRANPDFRPKAMLRVLTFGYATGVADSECIAQACRIDETFHRLCDGRAPDTEELIFFQRKSRELLKLLLLELMKRVVKKRFDCTLLPLGVKQYLSDAASLCLAEGELASRCAVAA